MLMIKEWFVKAKLRTLLVKSFRAGDIALTKKIGEKDIKVFPKIHAIQPKDNRIVYTFTLPLGLDPALIKKRMYCFQQVFGDNIEFNDDGYKKFVLTVYGNRITNEVKYNYDDILKHIQNMKLPIICGKDINGQFVSYDMTEHPHLLIAGETGSGKSTQLRSILTTLILSETDVQFFLCDMKMAEFFLFKRIKQVKGLSYTADQLRSSLRYIKSEMIKRSKLLDEYEVPHIDDLPVKLPYLILAIDEYSLLRSENDIVEIVEEISSIGRALGVFLILSLQRPDKDNVNGKIKTNMTVRMGFRVEDKINARIIGTTGSEKIENPGRFLMKHGDIQEIQSPLLKVDKCKKLIRPYMSNQPNTSVIESETVTEAYIGVLTDEGQG